MNRKELYRILKDSFHHWQEDDATLRAAALTFFIILPLPTLLLIVVAFFAQFFGQTQSIDILVQQITSLAGPAVADLFRQIITGTTSPFTSLWTAIVVVGFSVGGAIGAFSVLRNSMNCIWEVKIQKRKPLWRRLRQTVGPFILLSFLGLIVIFWTIFGSGLFTLIVMFSINETLAAISVAIAQVALSFAVSTLLLALIYKLIPETRIHWQDVYLAALFTGIAFTITNYVFGTYIQTFTVTTVIGTAGALLIILLWVFALNEMVLFGAEFSKIYATTMGKHSRLHLPETLEKIVAPLEKAGEIIEQASKDEFEAEPKKTENNEK